MLVKELNGIATKEPNVISGTERNVTSSSPSISGTVVKELNVTVVKELNVPVVPVKLHGLYELKRRQQYFAPPGMVSVVFGEPVKFDPRLEPTAIAEELQRRLEAM